MLSVLRVGQGTSTNPCSHCDFYLLSSTGRIFRLWFYCFDIYILVSELLVRIKRMNNATTKH